MATTLGRYPPDDLRHDLVALWGNGIWFILLGAALIFLGMIALGSLVLAALATALAMGVLLVMSGVAEIVGAFWSRHWNGFFLHLLSGVLTAVVGVLFMCTPLEAVLARTYGVYHKHDGTAERALFLIDAEGVICWSYLSPVGVNPGADGPLKALEAPSAQEAVR